MNKAYLSIICFLILLGLGACEKSDFNNKFDKTPDERIQEKISEFKTALTAPEFGWVFRINMANGIDNTVYGIAKFNDDYSVQLQNVRIPGKVSEYTIFAESDIELVFNTYNDVITYFAEPNSNLPEGYGTDQEYNIKSIDDNEIILEGKVLGTVLRLTKAKEDEVDLEPLKKNVNYLNQQRTAKYMSLEITEGLGATEEAPKYIGLDISSYLLLAEIDYNHNGEYIEVNKSIFFTHTGFGLSSAIEIDGEKIQYFNYNAEKKRYEVDHPTIKGFIFCDVLPMFYINGLYDEFMNKFSMKLTRSFGKAWDTYIPMKNANPIIKSVVLATDYKRRIPLFDDEGNPVLDEVYNHDYELGDDLEEGLLFSFHEHEQFYFYYVPMEVQKIEEDRIRLVRKTGEFCTEDAKDPSIGQGIKNNKEFQDFVNYICNDKGWMIRKTQEYGTIDFDFYSLEDPNNYFYSRLY